MSVAETTPTLKLVPFGQGLALMLDPDTLREAGIDPDGPVSLAVEGKSLRITAATRRPTEAELEAAMARINAKWGAVLKKLAE